ncbi:MAG: hypothetical protein WCH44_08560 [Betaproteobacteria bacterium]
MNIHQLSVIYMDEQDRILLRLNTTGGDELRLWLTRRMLARVMEPMQDAVGHLEARKTPLCDGSPASRRMLADLRRAEAMQHSDFSTPYQGQPVALPLGTQPLLVTQMTMTVKDDRQLQITFEERLSPPQEVRSFQIAMESGMLHGFMHLLEAAVAMAQWNLSRIGHGRGVPGGEDASADPQPRYLQ